MNRKLLAVRVRTLSQMDCYGNIFYRKPPYFGKMLRSWAVTIINLKGAYYVVSV